MTWWMIRDRASGEEQLVQSDGPYAPYDGDLFETAGLDREIDLERERWDWEASAIVLRATPQQARDEQWAAAKKYRDEDRYYWSVPVVDVVPDAVIMVQCDAKSREKVSDLAQAATWATMRGEALSITFTDGANVPFTVDAEQTIAIKAAVTLNDARCHMVSQVIRAELDAAVAAEASAADILAIDIAARFEELLAAGDPPETPES